MSEVDIYKKIAEKGKIYPTMVIRSQAETIELLEKENKKLQEKLNQYENPDDLTLFYMWLNEKAKDKMKQLQQENHLITEKLINAVNELENYRTRCEKANSMLKKLNIKLKDILKTGIDIKEISDIEDTLNGRSDE